MAIDDYLIEKERTITSGMKDVAIKFYEERGTGGKMLIVLILVIIGGLALWFVGKSVVGFMFTGLGIVLIGLTIIALALYFYMRTVGFGLKSWLGGIVEILLIMFILFVYVGLLDSLMLAFFQVMPLIIIGGVGWIGYKWYKANPDHAYKNGVVAILVTFLIAFPIFEAFVVPYTVGRPVELEVQVWRDDAGNWETLALMHDFSITQTMTITANPYIVASAEISHNMWKKSSTVDKAYVSITVQDDAQQEVIYSETNHAIYVSYSDTEYIWGVIHLPTDVEIYVHYPFKIISRVTDVNGNVVAQWSGVYYTD